MDDRDRIDRRSMWMPWAMASLAFVLVALVALVVGTRLTPGMDGGAPVMHAWHGFSGFFWIFVVFFFFFGFKRMCWWGGYPYYRPWRYRRRYYGHPYDDEREWEEWHRREHERMDDSKRRNTAPSGGGHGDPGRD